MSNDDWVKSHREMDITTRLLYWAQNEDMIDQYYTQRGKDLLEAEEEIQKLREAIIHALAVYVENDDSTALEMIVEILNGAIDR